MGGGAFWCSLNLSPIKGVNNRSEYRTETIQTEATGDGTSNDNNNSNNYSIWVRNILSNPLTEAQEKILSWGPNFAIGPKSPPVGKYIASIEHACSQLRQGETEELRGIIKTILKKIYPPKSNITIEERRALAEGKER